VPVLIAQAGPVRQRLPNIYFPLPSYHLLSYRRTKASRVIEHVRGRY
jgi:hypothetical protein